MIFNLNLNLLLLFSQINICANRNILLRRFHLRYLKIFVSVPFNCHLIIRKNSSIFEYVENYGIIDEQYCCSIEESLFVDGSGSPCLSHILACQVGGTDR